MKGSTLSTEKYLAYVRVLRDRVANKASRNGVTNWALGGAILYLMFQALPGLTKLIYSVFPITSFIVLTTHIFGFLVGCSWIYHALKGSSKFTKYDYRFMRNSLIQRIRMVISLCISEGVYFAGAITCLASTYYIHFAKIIHIGGLDIQLTFPEKIAFSITSFLIGFLLLDYLIGICKSLYGSYQDDYPSTPSLRANPRIPNSISFLLYVFFLVIPTVINGFYILFPPLILSSNEYEALVLLGFQLGFVALGTSYFLKATNDSEQLETLDKLERDIVLHELSEDDIKLHIQEEYLGNEFSSWLSKKIFSIKTLSSDLQALIGKEKDFKKELNNIPAELVYERSGRLDNFLENLMEKHDLLSEKKEMLEKCLNKIGSRLKSDIYLKQLIDQHLLEIESICKDTMYKYTLVLRRIEALR